VDELLRRARQQPADASSATAPAPASQTAKASQTAPAVTAGPASPQADSSAGPPARGCASPEQARPEQARPETSRPDKAAPADTATPPAPEPVASATPPAPDEPGAPADTGTQVTVVPGIGRYHRAECILIRFLGQEDLEVTTKQAADAAGSVPCKACRPD
jgi:hypothetical protein